jgi:hypothetical protein
MKRNVVQQRSEVDCQVYKPALSKFYLKLIMNHRSGVDWVANGTFFMQNNDIRKPIENQC